jgi:protein gp37
MAIQGQHGIAWTETTWNPVSGCSKVSQGCKHCYAERLFPRVYPGRKFTDVQTHPNRLRQPLSWRKPKRIFVNSMSDLFHEAIPEEFIVQVFAVMALAPRHQFQVLTKRPERMRVFVSQLARSIAPLEIAARAMGYSFKFHDLSLLPWPIPNVWLGVSVENQETADERIPVLLQTPAAVQFLSCEPLLEPINFMRVLLEQKLYRPTPQSWRPEAFTPWPKLSWVIVGGESGPKARPMNIEWVHSLVEQCKAADIAVFVKQLGGVRNKRGDLATFPPELQVREYPNVQDSSPEPVPEGQGRLFG